MWLVVVEVIGDVARFVALAWFRVRLSCMRKEGRGDGQRNSDRSQSDRHADDGEDTSRKVGLIAENAPAHSTA